MELTNVQLLLIIVLAVLVLFVYCKCSLNCKLGENFSQFTDPKASDYVYCPKCNTVKFGDQSLNQEPHPKSIPIDDRVPSHPWSSSRGLPHMNEPLNEGFSYCSKCGGR